MIFKKEAHAASSLPPGLLLLVILASTAFCSIIMLRMSQMPAPASPPVRCSPGNPPPRTPTPRPRSKSAGTSRKSTPGSWRPPFPPPPAPQAPTGARALPCCEQPAAAGRPSPRTRIRREAPAEPRAVQRPGLPSTCPAAALVVVQRAMMGAAAAEQIRSPRSE